QESVIRALEAAEGELDLVAVHDAVRPFFKTATFHALLDAAAEHGAAFPAMPVTDTIHIARGGRLVSTPERDQLVAAQTPQCFRIGILHDVLEKAKRDGVDGTDEAGLAARYGYEVRVVPGDAANFKITRAADPRSAGGGDRERWRHHRRAARAARAGPRGDAGEYRQAARSPPRPRQREGHDDGSPRLPRAGGGDLRDGHLINRGRGVTVRV